MSQSGQAVRNIVIAYIAIGVLIYLSQTFAGRACNPLIGERRAPGRESLVMTAILWPSDLVSHLSSGGPVIEYFAPTRCVVS